MEVSNSHDSIQLREVVRNDLPIFYEQQLNPDANWMAAFTAKDPTDRGAFDTHWAKILADNGIAIRTILHDGQVVGSVLCHAWGGEPEISYWLGREFWGKGIATQALRLFLQVVTSRPLTARVAKDNLASIRVLEKNGFKLVGEGKWLSNARGMEIDELVWVRK
ncbi:MAG: GNAT family N-acetyltransferase [Chloroflexi bacterium RBG_13_50_21]|nr:MAG: GNAT family N-acetyltransferase [Chloroflexi bacterium RBG_13_50_21]